MLRRLQQKVLNDTVIVQKYWLWIFRMASVLDLKAFYLLDNGNRVMVDIAISNALFLARM
jgi:hypothetical protein